MAMKECKACKQTKDFSEFRKRKDSKDGFRNVCRVCQDNNVKIGKVINETGKTVGQWKVLARAENNKDGSARWLCKCTCGTERSVSASTLREGKTLSCGCTLKILKKESRASNTIEKTIFRGYRTGALSRGHVFELTFQEAENLLHSDCAYCGDSPSDIKYFNTRNNGKDATHFIFTNGIDRVDNTKGYTLENCVPCCRMCNQLKSNHILETFFEKISKIYNKRMLDAKTSNNTESTSTP